MCPCILKREIIISILCLKGQINDGTYLCKLMFGVAQIAPHISQSFFFFLFGLDNNFGGTIEFKLHALTKVLQSFD